MRELDHQGLTLSNPAQDAVKIPTEEDVEDAEVGTGLLNNKP
jgi:hypothetical protein